MSKLIFLLVLATALIPSSRAELVDRKFYIIRSAQDGLVLKSVGGGALCKKAGAVITSSSSAAVSDSEKWLYSTIADWSYFDNPAGDYYLNEVSFTDMKPFCYPGSTTMKLMQVEGSLEYKTIRRGNDFGDCLTSHGDGVRITWSRCEDGATNQWWKFEEVA